MIWGEMSYNRLFGCLKQSKESPDDYIETEEEIESDEFMLGEDEKE